MTEVLDEISNHNLRSHKFFQDHNFWSNGTSQLTSNNFNYKMAEYNENIQMDGIMRLAMIVLALSNLSCYQI